MLRNTVYVELKFVLLWTTLVIFVGDKFILEINTEEWNNLFKINLFTLALAVFMNSFQAFSDGHNIFWNFQNTALFKIYPLKYMASLLKWTEVSFT